MAVAHKLVVVAFHMLKDLVPYRDLGGDYFDRLNPERTARKLLARLARLGYPIAAAVVQPDPLVVDPAPVVAVETAKPKRGRPRKTVAVGSVNPMPSIA